MASYHNPVGLPLGNSYEKVGAAISYQIDAIYAVVIPSEYITAGVPLPFLPGNGIIK